jgi:hypothetical protein
VVFSSREKGYVKKKGTTKLGVRWIAGLGAEETPCLVHRCAEAVVHKDSEVPAWRGVPVRYVLFDLLYHAGRCLLREPLARRRLLLAEVCERLDLGQV